MDNGIYIQCLEEFTVNSKYAKPKACWEVILLREMLSCEILIIKSSVL